MLKINNLSQITTKKRSKCFDNTNYCSIFAMFLYSYESMNQQTVIMEITEEESELLAAIRNYNKSFPDGYPQLLWYAQELFDNIIRQPYY